MSSHAFASEWPGREGWGPRRHHHHHHHNDADEAREGGRGRHGGPRGGRKGKRDFARELAGQWAFARGKHGEGHGRPSPEEIEELIAMRRMRGGPFSGPGPFGPRGRGRGRGGRRRRGDVRLAILRLLAEEPRNGYQLMQVIEERSAGAWRPSPGSVYPTLAQLEDEGLIRAAQDTDAKLFEITDAGREHLESRAGEPAPWEDENAEETSARDLKSAIAGIAAAAWQVAQAGTDAQRTQAQELLEETRRGLYRILAEESVETDETADVEDPETTV